MSVVYNVTLAENLSSYLVLISGFFFAPKQSDLEQDGLTIPYNLLTSYLLSR